MEPMQKMTLSIAGTVETREASMPVGDGVVTVGAIFGKREDVLYQRLLRQPPQQIDLALSPEDQEIESED